MSWSSIIPIIGVPAVRSIAGWLENSFKDGQIDKFEWAQLGATIVRVGIIGLGTYLGLNGMGVDVTALGASTSAVVLDFIMHSIKLRE